MAKQEYHPCPRCGTPAKAGWRYCYKCHEEIIAEMVDTNYLTPDPDDDPDWHGEEDEYEDKDEGEN